MKENIRRFLVCCECCVSDPTGYITGGSDDI